MSGLLDATQALVEDLRGSGVRVTMDSRNLNLPTVLVVPPSFVGDSSCGGTATFTIYAVTRAPANLDAWQSLDGLLDTVVKAIPEVRGVRASSYDVEGLGGLPALEISFERTIDF